MSKKTDEFDRRVNKLKAARQDIENGVGRYFEDAPQFKYIWKEWQEFLKMPTQQQSAIRREWAAYYEKARESTIAALFTEQRKGLEEENIVRVRNLAEQAKQMQIDGLIPEVTKPKFRDPWEYDNNIAIKAWKDAGQRIKELAIAPSVTEDAREAWS